MTIRIEITGENPAQVAQQLIVMTGTMAKLLEPRATVAQAVHEGPAADTVVEEVTETSAPAPKARRGKKVETIEHEPKEVQDVHRDAGSGDGTAGGESATSGIAAEHVGTGAADEAPAGVDAVAEADTDASAAAPLAEAVNVDDLRKYIMINYLNTFFPTLEVRKAKFDEVLDVFGAKKLSEVPADRLGEVKALVDGKIAALVGAK